jgi:hypothetical protein
MDEALIKAKKAGKRGCLSQEYVARGIIYRGHK